MKDKKICDPTWWRLGWVPYVVLVLVAAAADLCFPLMQPGGLHELGVGAGIGVLLFTTAVLLLRRDFSRLEQIFLGLLGVLGALALLVSGNKLGWLLALTIPFFVILFGSAKGGINTEPGVEYRSWWRFWRDKRHQVKGGFWLSTLSVCISVLVGVICFVAFLCIFASGNPLVEQVWNIIVSWWNRLVEYLQISWDFWAHVLIWGLGILGFGIFTVQRPAALPPVPAAESEPAGRSMLPHLPLMILLGVNLAFLAATGTDIAYLWFRRVPEGISLTQYLFEGAESIAWASVLAAALLLYFYRSSGSVRRTVVARWLGYALVGQTFLLAISVSVRLYNQIMVYAFTPRRVLAAELLLLGVVGLAILLCYMLRGGFLRWARVCIGAMLVLMVGMSISRPTALSGDLNLRFAPSLPQWEFAFSLYDFKHDCFVVEDNLAFALYAYEKQKATHAGIADLLSDEYVSRTKLFEKRLEVAALALEKRSASWTIFTLRDYWDRRAAEYILGRPIGSHAVEPVH